MKRIVCSLLLMMGLATTMLAQVLWIESADHYSKPKSLDLSAVDSVIFRYAQVRTYKNGAMTNHKFSDFLGYTGDGKSVAMSFKEPDQRLIWKPSTSDNNYNNGTSASATTPTPLPCHRTCASTSMTCS